MLAIGLFLGGGVALVFLLWLIRELAIFAMPFWAGLSAFLSLYHHQPGVFTPLLGGILAAGFTFAVWWVLSHFTNSPVLRGVVALTFAAPPTGIAYLGALQIAHQAIASAVVCRIVAIAAAFYIATQSWQRIVGHVPPSSISQHHHPA